MTRLQDTPGLHVEAGAVPLPSVAGLDGECVEYYIINILPTFC